MTGDNVISLLEGTGIGCVALEGEGIVLECTGMAGIPPWDLATIGHVTLEGEGVVLERTGMMGILRQCLANCAFS